MSARRIHGVVLLAALAGCQTILGLDEGTKREEGQGGAPATSSTTSTVSAGGAGGAVGGGGGAGGGCDPASCPTSANECLIPACTAAQTCGFEGARQGTPLSTQSPGDCEEVVCDGAGSTEIQADPLDIPGPDDTVCTSEVCDGTTPVHLPVMAGDSCADGGGSVCNALGACVECVLGGDCLSGFCQGNQCVPEDCLDGMMNGFETATDCGGPMCGQCDDGDGCLIGDDCKSGVCLVQCQAPACDDGVRNGSETDTDCGGLVCSICPTVLLLGGGGANVIVGEFHPATGWASSSLTGTTADGLALTITAAGQGVGLIRFTLLGDPKDNQLQYTTWEAGSSWAPFAAVGPAVTTRAAPALRVGAAQAAFQGFDYKYYHAAFNGTWSPSAEPVGAGAGQSFGPSPPDLAATAGGVALAFMDGSNTNHVTARDRTGGGWQPAQDLAADPNFNLTPAVVALTSGPELLLVHVRSPDKQVMWLSRTGGAWTTPAAAIPDAFTDERVALVALPGGAAMLAFRGTDSKLYTSRYEAGLWSAPAGIANPNVTLIAPPSLARGTGGAMVELVFVDSTNTAFHARQMANVWTAPVPIYSGAGFTRVAIASAP
jgi:hypothetical protein